MHCIIFLVGILQWNIALDLNQNIYFSISTYKAREVMKAANWRPFERAILYIIIHSNYLSSGLVESEYRSFLVDKV
jgi:hypothetical protein